MIRPLLLGCLLASPALAQPRFEDASGALPGPEHSYEGGWEHFVGGGVAVMDCNGDARPDMAVAGGEVRARLFVNATDTALRFVEGALPEMTGVTGIWPLMLDADHDVDLVVLRVGENLILRGNGDCTFTRANEALGFDGGDRWSTAFSATWERDATLPALAIGNYVDRDDPEGPFFACDSNELHRYGAAGYAMTPLEPGFCALSMLFSDYDRDRAPELRVSNDRHYYVRDGYEQMWELEPLHEMVAAGEWEEVSLWGMGIASQDITGDGLPEVMLTSMGDQQMMIADSGGYARAPVTIGTYATLPHTGGDGRPTTGWHAEFADVDNDGRMDLFIAKGNVDQMPGMAMEDPNNLLMQQPDGTFREAAAEAGIATLDRSRGAALADFDGDGLLDLVVINRRAPMELWRNVSDDAGQAITLDLHRDGPNPAAIGAVIEIARDGVIETRERTVGGGHGSGSLLPLHIGLGNAEAVQLRIIWPDAQQPSEWFGVAAGGSYQARLIRDVSGEDITVLE